MAGRTGFGGTILGGLISAPPLRRSGGTLSAWVGFSDAVKSRLSNSGKTKDASVVKASQPVLKTLLFRIFEGV